MGCDIHCYIEHRYETAGVTEENKKHSRWQRYGGRINPGRNYTIFTALAGVRDYGGEVTCLVPPRGVPADIGSEASWDYWLRVVYDEHPGEGCCSLEAATRLVAYSDSVLRYTDKPLENNYVSHPDWHTHSWLTPDEWLAALDAAGEFASLKHEPHYWAMLASMRELENAGQEVRVVFWFDN